MDNTIRLILGNKTVRTEAGELVSFTQDNYEYIHQKGSPGWRSSDTEMFPIIGPTSGANFRVQTPEGMAVQDQHGLLRELAYVLAEQTPTKAVFVKKYAANTKVKNSKYPEKSTEELLFWPYDFEFTKRIELTAKGVVVSFNISGVAGMPFMLGYHPAFKIRTSDALVKTDMQTLSIAEVMAVGDRALHIPNCQNIQLLDEKGLEISTEGFGDVMLWAPVPTMICIEPITFYPYAAAQDNLHSGFTALGTESARFSVFLKPLK